MKRSLSFPLYGGCFDEYGSAAGLRRSCEALGLDGVEVICGESGGVGEAPEAGQVVGYHLLFWADWVDLWRGDESALRRKFGAAEVWAEHYGILPGESGRAALIRQYRQDLARAAALGAKYAVLHVSDVSVEEGYTYRWEHTDEQVADAACELINAVTAGEELPFALLLENQWWPGFTFTRPELTARLLEGVEAADKGIMLDTGHLMNTCLSLKTEDEAADYICRRLEEHGPLARYVRGMHLHRSLSGEYVRAHTGALPEGCGGTYMERFAQSYAHILRIDRHEPWTSAAVGRVVQRVAPEFLTHELAAGSRSAREAAVAAQCEALRLGGVL